MKAYFLLTMDFPFSFFSSQVRILANGEVLESFSLLFYNFRFVGLKLARKRVFLLRTILGIYYPHYFFRIKPIPNH